MKLLQFIRSSKISKGIALLLAVLMLEPITGLKWLKAGSGGPTQPEYAGFTAVGASNLVDPFTGNVGYSVPLFEIGGYPVTMSYSGDISPEQDAGWVGLGWSLNVGSINRGLRGVPDDFQGDKVHITEKRRPKETFRLDLQKLTKKAHEVNVVYKPVGDDFFTILSRNTMKLKGHISYDNYTGLGFGYGVGFGRENGKEEATGNNVVSADTSRKEYEQLWDIAKKFVNDTAFNFNTSQYSLDMDYDSKQGFTLSGDIANNKLLKAGIFSLGGSASAQYNSRSGQFALGVTTGYAGKSSGGGYNLSFFYRPVMQAPLSQTVTRNYDLLVDISKPKAFVNKRKISIEVNYQHERLKKEDRDCPAFGMIWDMKYGQDYTISANPEIHDVEEMPKYIDKKTRQMPTASVNYDVFSINGAGIGGAFRIHPNYLTMFGPSANANTRLPALSGVHVKGEFGVGAGSTELGLNLGFTLVREKYEPLNEAEDFKNNNFYFSRKIEQNNNTYKPWDLRNDFEFIPAQGSFYNGLYGAQLMNLQLPAKKQARVQRKFYSAFDVLSSKAHYNVVNHTVSAAITKTQRDARQQVITYQNAADAGNIGFIKQLETYMLDAYGVPTINNTGSGGQYSFEKTTFTRTSGPRLGHHISEFTVLQPDGSRYYYGTPVYNYEQYDYRFNVAQSSKGSTPVNTFDFIKGTTDYITTGGNDLTTNDKGIDHYCEKKTTPSYAHSYLLNSILSSDYVDVTENGPTEDDLGNYVKFNYGMACGNQSSYVPGDGFGWRSLAGDKKADLDQGVKSDKLDDKGTFTFGTKELWYLHSIETKDQVAVFCLGKRLDGRQISENGAVSSDTNKVQMYLRKVMLFSKNEFKALGFNAEPVKVIHLEYSYDLCQSYPYNLGGNPYFKKHPLTGNTTDYNRGGKLTLHKIWTTYGKQNVPLSAPYIFEYNGLNPSYAYKSVDRWGTYKPILNSGGTNANSTLTSVEFPYTDQNKTNTDQYASAWMLTDITLPSGGKIQIEYESDDYAYVQDKPAMQMVPVAAVSGTKALPTGSASWDLLYDESDKFSTKQPSKRFLIFPLPSGVTDVHQMVNTGELLYYNFMVMMNRQNNSGSSESYEPINGFCEVMSAGLVNSSYGYVELKHEKTAFWKVNPIARNAIQQGLDRTPWVYYPGSDFIRNSNGAGQTTRAIIGAMFGFIPDILARTTTKYQYFASRDFAKKVDLGRSFIRLYSPSKAKLGGGHRVKTVSISDNWSAMTGANESSASYKLQYKYTTEDGAASSGVASYEPMIGSDENACKYPLDIYETRYLTDKKLKRKYDGGTKQKKKWNGTISFDLGPVAEQFYPNPSVGYSRVEIRTVYPTDGTAALYNRHKAGYTVEEFYTAKDFPVMSESTILERRQTRIGGPSISKSWGKRLNSMKPKFELDVSANLTYSTASQGFLVDQNDMHGKPKSNLVYSQDDNLHPFSGSAYFYKTDANGQLVNDIPVIHENGDITQETMGVDAEPMMFGSKMTSTAHSIRPNLDIDFSSPVVVPGGMLGYSLTRSVSKVVTMTKLVRRTGIVDSVVVYDKGAATSTKNIAWDGLTGQVLVTSVKNEYGDTRYSLTKPAHWMQKGIAGAYENTDLTWTVNLNTSGTGTFTSGLPLFTGDEVMVASGPSGHPDKLWALCISGSSISMIDKDGNNPPSGNYTLKILRSGHRNILGAGAETILLTQIPYTGSIIGGTAKLYVPADAVISGKGITFDDKRRVYDEHWFCYTKGCNSESSEPNGIITDGVATFVPCGDPESMGSQVQSCAGDGYLFGQQVNPFTTGIWGVWKPFGDYSYHDKRNQYAVRTQSEVTSGPYDPNYTDTRVDGLIKNYQEYWKWTGTQWLPNSTQDTSNPWTWTETLEQTDEKGNHTQTVNALGIYSAALYGYNNRRLVTATGANAKINEILFDGFEDISTQSSIRWLCNGGVVTTDGQPSLDYINDFCNAVRHWPIAQAFVGGSNGVTDEVSHTGWKSLKLQSGTTNVTLSDDNLGSSSPISGFISSYTLKSYDFIQRFYPTSGKDYIISYWVKGAVNESIDNSQFQLQIQENVSGTTYSSVTLTQEGAVTEVDGWKKFTYRFTPSSPRLRFKFINNGNTSAAADKQHVYLDDIRVNPASSAMTCYVYDYLKYRLMSTLDDNNFAVYFEYDEEGALVRKKVETVRGVMTVDENRNSLKR